MRAESNAIVYVNRTGFSFSYTAAINAVLQMKEMHTTDSMGKGNTMPFFVKGRITKA